MKKILAALFAVIGLGVGVAGGGGCGMVGVSVGVAGPTNLTMR